MKKIFSISVVALFMVSMNLMSFAQPDYAEKKKEFWEKYQIYKSYLDKNIPVQRPVDPSGIFYIDEDNNFAVKSSGARINNENYSSAPWINGTPDVVSAYTFSQTTTTYTPATGGTPLCYGSTNCDDTYFSGIALPFTFTYNGTGYTAVSISCNGWIMMGTGTPSGYTPICTGSYANAIAPFAGDLKGYMGGVGTDTLRYLTTGSAPNRVFTVEWYNWGFFGNGGLNEMNIELKLYETSNVIQFVYQPTTPTYTYSMQVGLMGTTNADYNVRTTSTSWSATTSGTACTYCSYSSSIYPSNGLTFTWSPPPTGPMGYYSSNTVQLTPGAPITPGTTLNQIVQVQVVDTGLTSPFYIDSLKFETTGSNNPGTDITNAKLYYTRSTNTFSTTRQYGSTVNGPNGVFYFSDTATLDGNATNYFWLTYDISGGAVIGDSVDAQCDSLFGTSPMGRVAPTISAPFGSRPIDPYCDGQYSIAGCPYGLYITNVTFGNINNTTGCNGNLPYCQNRYLNLTTSVRQNNPYPISVTNLNIGNPNATAFGIWIDWNNNISFADAGEYTPTSVIPANTTTSAYATITVPAGATLGNHRMRIRTNLSTPPASTTYCSTLTYGEQEDYTVNVIPDTNMYYVSSTTTQTVTTPVYTPSNNTQIIGIQVSADGTISPISATSFTLNTTGCTNPTNDITRAKLYYTGSNSNFGTTTTFGIKTAPVSGSYQITGSQQLVPGVNYFWLTYDIPNTAINGDTLDAQCTSITVAGTPRTPTITSPAGFRTISGNALGGVYTIPGNYPHFADAINDLNTKGTYAPVTFNVQPGFVDTAANLVINMSGTPTNPIVFKSAANDNPLSSVGSDNPLVNPVIIAGTGVGIYDGIIKFNGVSNITFNGIDLQENPANINTTTQMEWGYALLKPDGTHGNQNITIKNCNITLNKTNTSTYGIYSANINLTGTSQTVTNPSGANSNNIFLNNNITNSYNGMYVNGYADVAPYSFYDLNNTISSSSFTNLGGSSIAMYGIFTQYQTNVNISNNIINSRGGINSSYYMYGIYHFGNNSDVNITGNTITLADTTANTGYVYGIYNSQSTVNNVNITNNTLTNFAQLTYSYYTYFIYNAVTANNINITGNRIIGNTYGVAGLSSGLEYHIYNPSSAINNVNISNNLDSGNVVNGTSSYVQYYIYNSITATNHKVNNNRIVNNTVCGTSAAGTTYGIIQGGGTLSLQMDSNVVANNSLPTTSSQAMYCLYNSSVAPTDDYSYNTVSGNTGTGSGIIVSMYFVASPAIGSTVNITNNTVTNQSKTTATGTGTIYGIYNASAPQGTLNINNNTVTGFSSAAATAFYGIFQASSPTYYVNINNNRVGNFTNAGISTIYGIYSTGSTANTANYTISGDSVFNLNSTGASAGSTIYGMLVTAGFKWNIFKNRISDITTNTYTSAAAYGLYSSIASTGAIVNIYNNSISNINAPASTINATPAVSGMYIASGVATDTFNVFYNTIFLKATSSATTFSTAGIYALTTPVVYLKNNVVVDSSTPGSVTGRSAAHWRSSTILTTYTSTSNNNCFWAGAPSATHLIFYDGTNSIQTITAYSSFMSPREQNSCTEYPPFVNSVTPPYDLRIQTSVPTQLESGGQIISMPISITTDRLNVPRYPNGGYPIGGYTPIAPDIGAHEFGGLNADLTPPQITYAPLGNGGVASSRPFPNVTITDQSGVNVAPGTRPRCYYKKSTDANVFNDTTSATTGWKSVQSNTTASPFDFTIDYTRLNAGSVSPGDIIQYFVIAQDLAGTPNVGWNQGTFTGGSPTSVNLYGSGLTMASTLTYTIQANTLSGTYNVGTAQTYTSLTGAGGLFAAINASTVTGNITAVITSDLTEDGTNALNLFNETGPGGYSLTIRPDSAVVRTISGTVAQGMVRFNGARRTTIDGGSFFVGANKTMDLKNGGDFVPGKYLTFRNNNGANPTFVFINDAVGDSLKYCNIESNNTSTGSGTILFSTTTGTQGNDSNVIANCDIRDLSNATGTPANAIYSLGTTTTLPQYNNYDVVSNCNIYNNFQDNATFNAAVYLTSGSSDWTINGNSFYQTTSRSIPANATSLLGVYVASTLNNDIIITNNYFGGSAPLCGGSALNISGAGAFTYYGMYLTPGAIVPSSVQGNTIQNFNLTYSGASSSLLFRAVYVPTSTCWVNIGNISGNTVGSGTGNGSISLTINTTTASYTLSMINHFGFGAIMNNTVGSITIGGNSTGTAGSYFMIYHSNTTAGQTYTISNNLVGSLATANSIQCTNLADAHALRGIFVTNGAGTTDNITNNIVANLTSLNNNAIALSSVYGIQFNTATNSTVNMTGNTVRNLIANCNFSSASLQVAGLVNIGIGLNTFSQNTVYSLYANGTTGAQVVVGILAGGASTLALGGTVSQNKIFDLRLSGTGAPVFPAPALEGIYVQANPPYTVSNNMVSITNGDPLDNPLGLSSKETFKQVAVENPPINLAVIPKDNKEVKDVKPVVPDVNPVVTDDSKKPDGWDKFYSNKGNKEQVSSVTNTAIMGIYHINTNSFAGCSYYYNTIYVGGTQPGGSYSSWDFLRNSTGVVNLRNNLFINARNGGAANYCIGNEGTNPVLGWSATASNYNALLDSNANTVGEWGLGNAQNFTQWKVSSGGDNQTWSTQASTVSPSSLLTSIGTGDLTIQSGNSAAWLISGKGIAVTGQSIDFQGDPRVTTISGGCTDIGADEFAATPPSNPVATQVGTPGAGLTTTYTLYGRTLCQIDWGTGGTSYPTSMNVVYNSGVNPSPNVTSPNRSSNSNWVITIGSGSLVGAKYDLTLFFGDNETYTITSPSTNTLLGKYSPGTFWTVYPGGTGQQQSNLNWSGLSVQAAGINNSFSQFALTDAALPAISLVSPPNESVVGGSNPTLVWTRSAGSTTHHLQVATDSAFTSIVKDTTTADTSKALSGLANQRYWWHVQGTNGIGTGGYGQLFRFNVVAGAPPLAPILYSPPCNSVGQLLSLTLVWYRSATAVTYRVQVATDSLFSGLILNDSTVTDSTRAISGLTPLTNYWWRVSATNAFGTGPFSPPCRFRTMGPPTQVTLLNPPNNATNQPISLQFRWSRAVDQTSPIGGKAEAMSILNYWWELRTDTTLSNLQVDSTLTDTTKSVSGLNYSTTYFWRVRAKNQIGWGAFSVWFRFTTMPPPPAIVNLTVIPGGFYNTGTQRLNMRDTIRVYLVDSVSCLRVDSTRGVLDSVTFSIPNTSFSIANTGNYYIFVYHRNHLAIASRFRQNIVRGSTVSYDFTTDSAKAYGFNMIKVSNSPVRWGMIPGDANQDGFVDGLDQTIWIGQNGLDGYLSADFNGDGFVDGLDQTIWILMNGQSTFLPCGFVLWNPTERLKTPGQTILNFPQPQSKNTKGN